MENKTFAKIANYPKGTSNKNDDGRHRLLRALDTLIKELNIRNGSFRIFVRDGKAGHRVEVQNHLMTDLES